MENFIPSALRRSYYTVENAEFYGTLKSASTVSILEGEAIEILIKNQMELLALGYLPNVALVNPADYGTILTTPLGTSGAVTINGSVNFIGGVLNIGGIDVLPANFVPENEYLVMDSSQMDKIVCDGMSFGIYDQHNDNIVKNMLTCRLEQRSGLAVYRGDAILSGLFVQPPLVNKTAKA